MRIVSALFIGEFNHTKIKQVKLYGALNGGYPSLTGNARSGLLYSIRFIIVDFFQPKLTFGGGE